MVLPLMKDFLSSIYTGCFLKNAANCSSVIYCPILINKRSNTMVKKILQNGLFFSTLTVMSNTSKCHFVFLNGNICLYIFIMIEIFF
jgi:hypothetical protein